METIVVWIIVGITAFWLLRKFIGNWQALTSGQTAGGCPSCSSKGCCSAAQVPECLCVQSTDTRKAK